MKGRRLINGPRPFEVHESGTLLHGTKADLTVGDLLVPGRLSNYEAGRVMNHIYVTETLDAAVWGAELAAGDARGRIYMVEPTGSLEDDPNVTDKKFPGNPLLPDSRARPHHRRAQGLGGPHPRATAGDEGWPGRPQTARAPRHLRLTHRPIITGSIADTSR